MLLIMMKTRVLGEPKKTERTRILCSQNVEYLSTNFQNNSGRWNSACQSFNLTTLLSRIRVSKNFHTLEVRTK